MLLEYLQFYQYNDFMLKRVFIIFSLLFLALSLYSLPFNDKLTSSELDALQRGEVVLRSIDKEKNMSIMGENEGIKAIKEEVKAFNPNYLAEIIQVRPVSSRENLAEEIRKILEDIEGYAGIQYWSEQHERYWDLYKEAKVLDKSTEGMATRYHATLYMQPFGEIDSIITLTASPSYLLYTNYNLNNLKFNGKFKCISKERMKSSILVFREGDNWILYGVGGCKSIRMAGVTARVEKSIMNRIKTFCQYIFTKLD